MQKVPSPFGKAFLGTIVMFAAVPQALALGSTPRLTRAAQSEKVDSSILVSINFNVRDNHSRAIKNLRADQVHISFDGKERPIESITQASSHPISIVFLADQSNSRGSGPHGNIYPELQPALDCFRGFVTSGASVQVAEFDTEPKAEGGFTTTGPELFASMQKLAQSRPGGATALFDSIVWASRQLGQRPGFRVIVVSTDGDDNVSNANLDTAISEAQNSRVSAYFVNFSHIEIMRNERVSNRERNLLKEIARRVGGESLTLDSPKDGKQIFDRIAEDIATSYNVSFRIDSSGSQNELRSLRVAVDGDHLKIFAPSGDYTLAH